MDFERALTDPVAGLSICISTTSPSIISVSSLNIKIKIKQKYENSKKLFPIYKIMAMIFLNTENFADPEFLKEQVWRKSILKMMKMIQGSSCHLGIKFGVK